MKGLSGELLQNEKNWYVFSAVVLTLYLMPLLSAGQNLYVQPFDFLDSTVPQLKVLAQSGLIFADSLANVPNMMDGLPRLSYGSEFNYLLWLFVLFQPFTAYAVNEVLTHAVAFVSMVLFLKGLRLEWGAHSQPVIFGAALSFALLPFFPSMGLSIPLLPLVMRAFIDIRASQASKWQWGVVTATPFFSSFVLVYAFFLLLAGTLLLADLFRQRRLNLPFLGAITLMALLYGVVEYRLVFSVLFEGEGFVSHRTEFVRKYVSFADAYRGGHTQFLLGQLHTVNLQADYLIPTILLAIVLLSVKTGGGWSAPLVGTLFLFSLFTEIWQEIIRQKYFLPVFLLLVIGAWVRSKKEMWLYGSLLFLMASAMWYGFWYYQGWAGIADQSALFRMFDFSRFALMQSAVWYVAFALACIVLVRKLVPYGVGLVAVVMLLQVMLAFGHKTFQYSEGLSYKWFYDTALFDRVAERIGGERTAYRVGSVGIPPGVALYNGFYTLDGYSTNYPLAYKKKFEKIIVGNFSENGNAERFFRQWGSQCYLIAGDKDYNFYEKGKQMSHFKMDGSAFCGMGGRFVFSGYAITAPETYGLRLLETFPNPEGFWSLWLYACEPSLS